MLESLPAIDATPESSPNDQAGGFTWYNNSRVNGNTRLLGTQGTTQISIYARDVKWRYAFGSGAIRSPRGNGNYAGSGWRFPNARQFGIVVYQGNRYWNVQSTSSSSPTVISGISNTQPIVVTVNDTNGNAKDNGGAFDIYIRKDN